jgi:hypothetical protein
MGSAQYCYGVIYMDASFDIGNYKTEDRVCARTTMAFLIAQEIGTGVRAGACCGSRVR